MIKCINNNNNTTKYTEKGEFQFSMRNLTIKHAALLICDYLYPGLYLLPPYEPTDTSNSLQYNPEV